MYLTTSNFFISFQKIKLPPVSVTTEEKSTILSMLYPKSRAKQMNPKKKYVCAVCKSSCDLYGLFNHMKQVRNKNIIFPYNYLFGYLECFIYLQNYEKSWIWNYIPSY